MIASSIAVFGSIRFATRVVTALASFLYGHPGTGNGVTAPRCFVAVTAVIAMPDPYRVTRVVTTGVREYEDDGNGTVAYCEPRDVGRLRIAREAVDRRIATSHHDAPNVEHVVIRSTSPTVAAQHLVYIAAASRGAPEFTGIEIVALKAPDGTEFREIPLPPLLATDSARTACGRANLALRRNAASFHWAC
jgi:hypothetical protein